MDSQSLIKELMTKYNFYERKLVLTKILDSSLLVNQNQYHSNLIKSLNNVCFQVKWKKLDFVFFHEKG